MFWANNVKRFGICVILRLENIIKKENLYKILNKYLDKKFQKIFWGGFAKLVEEFYDQKWKIHNAAQKT